jgi:Protein of unknown function (DUF732)
MRDRDTIDSELRLLAAELRSIRERGGRPSSSRVDELLDERLGHLPERPQTSKLLTAGPRRVSTTRLSPRRRRRQGVLLRFGLRAALPLSLIAVATAAILAVSALRNSHPAAQQADAPPSDVQPGPAAPQLAAPPVAHAPTVDRAAPVDMVDKALVDALKQQGVPVPNQDYVTTHAHAVCDFLSRRTDFAEAARFIQQSTIWDADQSTEVVAGATISYCPQYQPANSSQLPQAFQKTLSDLQSIEGELQGIREGLPGG